MTDFFPNLKFEVCFESCQQSVEPSGRTKEEILIPYGAALSPEGGWSWWELAECHGCTGCVRRETLFSVLAETRGQCNEWPVE